MPMTHRDAAVKFDETSNEMRWKIELYFLALTFTVIGWSIQSTKFSGDFLNWLVQIIPWALLIGSGLVTLRWLQRVPDRFANRAYIHKLDGAIAEALEEVPPDGATMDDGRHLTKAQIIADLTRQRDETVESDSNLRDQLRALARRRNPLFIWGIILLGLSRAYVGLVA